jgi:transcriptional regulator with XRE-family HTH domain
MGACSLHSRLMAMSQHEVTGGMLTKSDWEADLIHDLGKWTRKVREFLNFSQDKLAKLAGVSQGAVSRVEAGRGKATPLLTFTKINQVFAKALSELDPSMLSEEAKAMLERARYMAKPVPEQRAQPSPLTLDPAITWFISTYNTLPERGKQGLMSVVRATASSLGTHPQAMVESPIERAARTPN